MTYYQRYINGEDGRAIYNEIYSLSTKAFNDEYFNDIEKVLTETFYRVAFNLEIIFLELKDSGYAFKSDFESNSDKPLLQPLSNTNSLLAKLDEATKDFGHLPYSLKLFYKIVGACNFGWDYENNPVIPWPCADPIQICSVDDLVEYVLDDDWEEYVRGARDYNDSRPPYLELAADYLHKDNISGGEAYAIQLTKEQSIDALLLNEPHQTTFINYLRICMENCGFSRINPSLGDDFHNFFAKVYPQLKKI